jgi:hypothetical protein
MFSAFIERRHKGDIYRKLYPIFSILSDKQAINQSIRNRIQKYSTTTLNKKLCYMYATH